MAMTDGLKSSTSRIMFPLLWSRSDEAQNNVNVINVKKSLNNHTTKPNLKVICALLPRKMIIEITAGIFCFFLLFS